MVQIEGQDANSSGMLDGPLLYRVKSFHTKIFPILLRVNASYLVDDVLFAYLMILTNSAYQSVLAQFILTSMSCGRLQERRQGVPRGP